MRIKQIYTGRIVGLSLERVSLPNHTEIELEVVTHPGGSAVVALDEQRRVCLLEQYRHVAGGWLWELPAGKHEPDDPPAETARRELLEEAGLSANDWQELGKIHSSPGIFTEVIHLYLAQGLQQHALQHEQAEVIRVHWLDLDEAVQWALEGRISDAKTVVGLLRANARLSA